MEIYKKKHFVKKFIGFVRRKYFIKNEGLLEKKIAKKILSTKDYVRIFFFFFFFFLCLKELRQRRKVHHVHPEKKSRRKVYWEKI